MKKIYLGLIGAAALWSIPVQLEIDGKYYSYRKYYPCIENDCDCKHFQFQETAQKVFELNSRDIHNLDGDGDNKACEHLASKKDYVPSNFLTDVEF